MNYIRSSKIGQRKIGLITIIDAKAWFQSFEDEGLGYSSIANIRGVIRPTFREAVRD